MIQPDGDLAWAEYPLNSPLYEPTLYNGAEIREHLGKAPTNCFTPSKKDIEISLRVIDIKRSEENGVTCGQTLCRSVEKAEQIILDPNEPRIRIISVHSLRTVQPLRITAPLMRQMLNKYKVAPEFVPIIFSFGENSELAESGNCNLYLQPGPGKSRRLSYEIRYVENNRRNEDDPWSRRHTGVYHHHDSERNLDLFILLQSVANSTAESRLLDLVRKGKENIPELTKMCDNPFRMHLLLASSYFPNWRWYLRKLAKDFNKRNDSAMTVRPEDPTVTYDRVQGLRHIQDLVIGAKASCKGDLQVVRGIMRLRDPKIKELHQLAFQARQLEGFIDSAEVLRARISNTIDLIGYTLDHHTQIEAARQGTIVTIITWVSAIYLPGTFAGTLYGMNFFVFDTQNNSIGIARDAWIFVATWVPLMIFTYGLYYTAAKYQDHKQGKPIKWLWQRHQAPHRAGDMPENHT